MKFINIFFDLPVYMWWVAFIEIWALRKHKNKNKTFNCLRAIIFNENVSSIKSVMTYPFNWKYRTLFVQRTSILPIHRSFPCPTKGFFWVVLNFLHSVSLFDLVSSCWFIKLQSIKVKLFLMLTGFLVYLHNFLFTISNNLSDKTIIVAKLSPSSS